MATIEPSEPGQRFAYLGAQLDRAMQRPMMRWGAHPAATRELKRIYRTAQEALMGLSFHVTAANADKAVPIVATACAELAATAERFEREEAAEHSARVLAAKEAWLRALTPEEILRQAQAEGRELFLEDGQFCAKPAGLSPQLKEAALYHATALAAPLRARQTVERLGPAPEAD